MGTVGTNDEGYDLRMETNEFLTELASGLSEENENMGALLRRTIETLRTLSGCEKEGVQEGGMVVQMESGYENLAAEMDVVIEHLRTLLTNPSFVPLEEVEVREEEIIRLREGWERMEARWREAVQMMDGWRKRMARSGQTVNLEELKMGLMLSPLKPTDGTGEKGFQLSPLMEEGETIHKQTLMLWRTRDSKRSWSQTLMLKTLWIQTQAFSKKSLLKKSAGRSLGGATARLQSQYNVIPLAWCSATALSSS